MKHLSACILAALCATSYASPINGILETGKSASVIYEFSPESGDAIAYYFKNNTPAGKAILSNCLNEMVCSVEKSKSDENNDINHAFSITPSVVFEVKKASDIRVGSDIESYEKEVDTRYGKLTINDEDVILLNNRPLKTGIEANSGLSFIFSTEMDDRDIILVMNTGGSGCPALFSIINLGAKNFHVSEEFGTCSDLIRLRMPNNQLHIDMVDFRGPFEPEADQIKASKTIKKFIYSKNGEVKEVKNR